MCVLCDVDRYYRLTFVGPEHCGIVDTKNLCRLAQNLSIRLAVFQLNDGPIPHITSPSQPLDIMYIV